MKLVGQISMNKLAKISLKNLITVFTVFVFGALFFVVTPTSAQVKPLQLSQRLLTLGVGEKRLITADSGTGLTVWSTSNAVNASLTGPRSILLTGVRPGVTKVTVCSQDAYCDTANVTVSLKSVKSSASSANLGASVSSAINKVLSTKITKKSLEKIGSAVSSVNLKVLKFNTNNISVEKNESVDVYAINSNILTASSDSDTVRTAVNGNRITMYGTLLGLANVKICNELKYCGIVKVKVVPHITGIFGVSDDTVTMETNSSFWLHTQNGAGIIVKSNSSVVKPTVVDNLVMLRTGGSTGRATVKICDARQECLYVFVTVKRPVTKSTVKGSIDTITLSIGQTAVVPYPSEFAISYKIIGNPFEPLIADLKVNKDNFTITGKDGGTVVFKLCPVNPDYRCGTIAVTVINYPKCDMSANGNLQLSNTSITLTTQESVTILASSCDGLRAISELEDIVRTAVNGYNITLYGTEVGDTTVQVCDASGVCTPLLVKVVKVN